MDNSAQVVPDEAAVDLSMAQAVAAEADLLMPVERAWSLMRDLSLAHHYVPGLVGTEVIGEPASGVGARRRVYRSQDRWLIETVLEWKEGSGFLISVHHEDGRSPLPLFSTVWFRYQLLPATSGDISHCRACLTLYFRCRPLLGFIAYPMALLMKGMQRQLVHRLKKFYESSASGDGGESHQASNRSE